MQRFLIFGHRGSPARFPENTPASFDEALRTGADGFETDLRLLSDGAAVLYHDDEVGDAVVESLSSSQLRVPRVSELAQYASRTTMVLEVKRRGWEDRLLEEIATWPNVIVASFDHAIIEELHRRNVAIDLGITTYGNIAGIGGYAKRLGAKWCFPSYRYVDESMVRSLHDQGVKVVPWTPNRDREWQVLSAAGCDGVITDVPHDAVVWRDSVLGARRSAVPRASDSEHRS